MKIITLLILIYFSVYASSLETIYKNLNQEILKSSAIFPPEKKLQLLYLTLATHNKILSNSSTVSLQKKTIKLLSEIKNTTKIQSLYLAMLKENTYLQEKKDNSLSTKYLLFILLSMIISMTIGYSLKKRDINASTEDLERLRKLVEDLKNKNTHLNYKLESVNTLKESFFIESKNALENLEHENQKLTQELQALTKYSN